MQLGNQYFLTSWKFLARTEFMFKFIQTLLIFHSNVMTLQLQMIVSSLKALISGPIKRLQPNYIRAFSL